MSLIWVARPNVIYLVAIFEQHCGLSGLNICTFCGCLFIFMLEFSFIALLPKFVYLDRSFKNALDCLKVRE